MSDKDIRILVEALVDYLEWEKTIKANGVHRPITRDSLILIDFLNGKISKPLTTRRKPIDLPDPFDPYLRHQSHRVSPNYLRQMKGILASFRDYPEKHSLALSQLKIEDLEPYLLRALRHLQGLSNPLAQPSRLPAPRPTAL